MKKLLNLFVLAGILFSSCSRDDGFQDSSSIQEDKREQARELLIQMNETNPYSKIGIGHNELVSDYLAEIIKTTRSGDTINSPSVLIKEIVMQRVDSMLTIDAIEDYTITEFEEAYDTVMTSYFQDPSNYFQTALSEGDLDDAAHQYIQQIKRIVNRDENIVNTLTNLRVLQRIVAMDSLCIHQETVLSLISVAANSCEYWDEVIAEIPDGYQPILRSNIVNADLEMAGVTSCGNLFLKIMEKAVSWKYVVAVSAGASLWKGITEINWNGIWDWATSWI